MSSRKRRSADRDLGFPPSRAIAPDRLTPSPQGYGSLGCQLFTNNAQRGRGEIARLLEFIAILGRCHLWNDVQVETKISILA